MSRAAIAISLFAVCVPGICEAKEICAWLNEATAAGTLDGQVTFTVKHTSKENDDQNCEFVRHDGRVVMTLRIEVETTNGTTGNFSAYKAQCTSDATPLRAIGNEAVICSATQKTKMVSEQVVGRVRDRVFLVRITWSKNSSEQNVMREKTQQIAEQIAGILF